MKKGKKGTHTRVHLQMLKYDMRLFAEDNGERFQTVAHELPRRKVAIHVSQRRRFLETGRDQRDLEGKIPTRHRFSLFAAVVFVQEFRTREPGVETEASKIVGRADLPAPFVGRRQIEMRERRGVCLFQRGQTIVESS